MCAFRAVLKQPNLEPSWQRCAMMLIPRCDCVAHDQQPCDHARQESKVRQLDSSDSQTATAWRNAPRCLYCMFPRRPSITPPRRMQTILPVKFALADGRNRIGLKTDCTGSNCVKHAEWRKTRRVAYLENEFAQIKHNVDEQSPCRCAP